MATVDADDVDARSLQFRAGIILFVGAVDALHQRRIDALDVVERIAALAIAFRTQPAEHRHLVVDQVRQRHQRHLADMRLFA
ncbi:hypothetical protein D9M72_608450 [compost metagenome]